MASGDTLFVLHPYMNEPPAAAFATLDARNQRPRLDFDDTTDEAAVFSYIMPQNYSGQGLLVILHITDTADTTAAHASYWDVSFENGTGLDQDSDSFDSAQSNHAHPNGTSGIDTTCEISFTNAQIDGIAAGDPFRIKVVRDADNGSDDWSGDAELTGVEVREA